MLRLIQADLAATGKPHFRDGTPSRFLTFSELYALLRERSHFGFQIVAHEIKFVGAARVGRVDGGFRRRQSEDQPAMTRIHGFETEDFAEKRAVRFGVFAVNNYVGAGKHLPSKRNGERLTACRVGDYRDFATLAMTNPAKSHISVKSTRFTTVYAPENPHQFQLGRSTITLEASPTTARNTTRLA